MPKRRKGFRLWVRQLTWRLGLSGPSAVSGSPAAVQECLGPIRFVAFRPRVQDSGYGV